MDTRTGLRETLIYAALKILEVESEEPTLRAVARAAGVSAMAPYRHFPDKAGLMAAVANRGFEMMRSALILADNQPDAREALFAQGIAFISFARTNPALFRLMFSYHYGYADRDTVEQTYQVLATRIAHIVPRRAIAAGTLACWALLQGMATIEQRGSLASEQPDDITFALRLVVSGLGASLE